VLIFIVASFDLSSEALLIIVLRASSQDIIFSFQTSLALHSSALNSLYLLNHITIVEASIHKTKSKTIEVV
jgi:hypothetical protein